MARYVYKCLNCEKIFEKDVGYFDEKVNCPNCNSEWVQKKFSSSVSSSPINPPSHGSGCG